MNIKDLFVKKSEDLRYATSFRRSTAAMIDMWIVLILRIIVMQVLGSLWLNGAITDFIQEFYAYFGTETVKNTPEHIAFVVNHRIFAYALIFYSIVILVGAFYHAYLNSSAWKGSVGKRLMKMMIVREPDTKIRFRSGLAHYFLSILPFFYIFFILSFQMRHDLTFFEAITYSETHVFIGLIFIIWVQIHIFTKRKTTAYDLICKTIFINGKTMAKFPWTKDYSDTQSNL